MEMMYVYEAFIFSVIGLILYALAFVAIYKLTSYALAKEILEGKNIALAILLGSIMLGLSNIIAAAVH